MSVVGLAEYPGGGARPGELPRLPTILRGPELARLGCRAIDLSGRDVTDERERLAPGVRFLTQYFDPAAGIQGGHR